MSPDATPDPGPLRPPSVPTEPAPLGALPVAPAAACPTPDSSAPGPSLVLNEAIINNHDNTGSCGSSNDNNDNSSNGDNDNGTAKAHGSVAPAEYEETHVHSVYTSIASHFSSTRHKPWPFVSSFLNGLPPGSVGLDVGCGNGKYIPVNPDVVVLASDRSDALVRIAAERTNGEVVVADGLGLPYRLGGVDFVICIAVVHHLSTAERRREAIKKLLECVRVGGEVLVYVWALEQGSSRRGWDEGGKQDLLVPWVMKGGKEGGGDETYQRYYHLYRQGELEEDCEAAGGRVLRSGYEKDNWWAICTRRE